MPPRSETTEAFSSPSVPVMSGLQRLLYLLLGLLSLGMAYVGWLLPGIPCTPFVLLASYCFSHSSPRLQRWLLNNRLFGSYLRDFHQHRGIKQHIKIKATCIVVFVVTCSVTALIWIDKPWYLWAFIPPLALIGLTAMWLMVKTLPNDQGNAVPGHLATRNEE
ncbi:MAG: YbaN family protein [Gemmatales bacterium]